MRPHSEIKLTEPNPSREVAAEILRRHRHEEKNSWLPGFLTSLINKLLRRTPPKAEPPQWPFSGVRQPLGHGPRPRSGAVAMKEPW